MKKLLSFILILLFSFSFIRFSLHANEVTTKTDDGSYYYTTVSEEVKSISASTTWIENTGKTKNGDQLNHVFVADFKSNENIKIATWAISDGSNYAFARTDLKKIAEDYQKNNPGWIVLAGVNADQYYPKYGTSRGTDGSAQYYPQTYYPLISNGDNWFVINPYGNCGNVAGFKNDNSDTQIVYGDRSVAGFYMHIYDRDNNYLGKYLIDDLNMETLGENQTTVLSPVAIGDKQYNTVSKDSSNGFYVVENADLAFASNSKTFTYSTNNCFFGKGTINKIYNQSCYLRAGQFAIETTNEELKSVLKKGLYVKCQYEYDEGFAGIEEATGYHTIQRSNGKDNNVANSYNSRPYPRSIFGCDNNGKVYLITCSGSNSSPTKGMWAQESNALCKYYGITDAFQCDGGGSVTAVVRDEDGNIQYAMNSIEGSYRYILTGLFIVMKVPEAIIEVSDNTSSEVKFNIDMSNVTEDYDKAYLKIQNSEGYKEYKEISGEELVISNLEADTEYTYQLAFKYKNSDEYTDTLLKSSFKTDKNFARIGKVSLLELDDKYQITIEIDDNEKVLSQIGIILDGRYHRGIVSDGVATIELNKDTLGVINFDIRMECNLQNKAKTKEFKDLKIDASAALYVEYVQSRMEVFINKLFR